MENIINFSSHNQMFTTKGEIQIDGNIKYMQVNMYLKSLAFCFAIVKCLSDHRLPTYDN